MEKVFIKVRQILVVDDCPEIRDCVVMLLREEYQGVIDCASNGQEALTKLRSGNYDLCFTDHRMPLKCGGDMIVEAHKEGIKTPFVMYSGTPPNISSPNLFTIVEKPNIQGILQALLLFNKKIA